MNEENPTFTKYEQIIKEGNDTYPALATFRNEIERKYLLALSKGDIQDIITQKAKLETIDLLIKACKIQLNKEFELEVVLANPNVGLK